MYKRQEKNYEKAKEEYKYVVDNYGDSTYGEKAFYWYLTILLNSGLQSAKLPCIRAMEPLAKVELVLSSRSGIALILRKPFAEPDPTGKLRLPSIFQRMVDSFLLIWI